MKDGRTMYVVRVQDLKALLSANPPGSLSLIESYRCYWIPSDGVPYTHPGGGGERRPVVLRYLNRNSIASIEEVA